MATEIGQNLTTCPKCGADVRENTAFCYKCGTSVVPEPDPAAKPIVEPETSSVAEREKRTQSALDDLALRLENESKDEKQLTKAAGERRRARIAQRKAKPLVWEPDEGSSAVPLILATLIVLIVSIFVVYFTTISK